MTYLAALLAMKRFGGRSDEANTNSRTIFDCITQFNICVITITRLSIVNAWLQSLIPMQGIFLCHLPRCSSQVNYNYNSTINIRQQERPTSIPTQSCCHFSDSQSPGQRVSCARLWQKTHVSYLVHAWTAIMYLLT